MGKNDLKSKQRYVLNEYYDYGRLTTIVQPTELGESHSRSYFSYDGFNRRAQVVEQSWDIATNTWNTDSATRYIYDGMDVVQERNAGDNEITVKYVRFGNIGGLLARIEPAAGETPEKQLFYHYDGSGNVTELIDSTQAVVAKYDYDAYGRILSSSGVEANQPYRYSTKWFHARSGLYDYGYRFYSPSMGRWINRDPIEEDGGLNLYASFENDGVNKWDEYGEAVPLIAGGIAAYRAYRLYKAYRLARAAHQAAKAARLLNMARRSRAIARARQAAQCSSKYTDITKPGSVPNRIIDLTSSQFEKTLSGSGWTRSLSKDGNVSIFIKNGARYVLRSNAKSTGGPTADFYRAGSKGIDVKIRLR